MAMRWAGKVAIGRTGALCAPATMKTLTDSSYGLETICQTCSWPPQLLIHPLAVSHPARKRKRRKRNCNPVVYQNAQISSVAFEAMHDP